MTETSYRHLAVSDDTFGVRTIELRRPDVLNAVNPALAGELPMAAAAATAEDAVRVVVITGAGRAFCAGLDLADPAGLSPTTRAERHDRLEWVGRWVLALAACEKPVVAAINGPAAGAGLGLALAADIRLLSDAAVLTTGYVRRGLSPDGGVSYFLPRIVGAGRATELLLTGRDVRPDEAERMGLVSVVYPAAEFGERVSGYARALAAGPPVAQAFVKRLALASLDATLEQQLRSELQHIRQCFATRDVREAMAAFQEKRAPVFRGE